MDTRSCDYCGRPLPPGARSNQRYCGRTHKRQARRQAKRAQELHERLVTRYPPYGDASLSELDARRRERRAAQEPAEHLREFSDYGMVPGDLDGQAEEYTERAHMMIAADAERRTPRRLWSALKRMYAANPGVELPSITQERVERHQAQQNAVKRRLRAAPGQVQDRHNDHTRHAVAERASTSRKLNRHYATADRPPSQRESFAFEAAESVDGSFYGGRPRGQQSRHAAYQWSMEDGFRY